MKTTILALCLTAAHALAQTATSQEEFEAEPMLKASEILKPEIAVGPNHRVLENVTSSYGRNRYTIETPWGFFTADCDAILMSRVAEARALAELQNVSQTEEYKQGLKAAAKAPLQGAQKLIEDPVGAVKGGAKGVWKFMNQAGESVKNVAQGRKSGQGEDNFGERLVGLSKAKRTLAVQLGADPYSSNEVFQKKLEEVAWTSVASTWTFKLATLPIGGGVGIALTTTQATQNFNQLLRDKSPQELRLGNKKLLIEMGVTAKAADAFLANPAFSPSNQTAFVFALNALRGVKNRAAFVKLATETATDEPDALFCSGTAQLLATLHAGGNKIGRIAMLGDLPVAIADDGRLVVALQWDTAFWSQRAEQFIERAQSAQVGQTGPVVIAITGNATARTKAELEKRGIGLLTLALPGPQK